MGGAVAMAEKMAQFDAKKFAEMNKASGGGDSGKKEKKKADKPKPEQQPKKEKKEATPAPDEDKSVPYFWEKFDKDNYSIWRCDYKYNDELTMVFMSCNLMGGMFQRLEKLRKNAFASMALFGENNNP